MIRPRILFPWEDRQQDPPYHYCDRCNGEIYIECDPDAFGAILCDECKEELKNE